jgi:hypothetical protein
MDYNKLILKKYKIKITLNTKNGYILGNYISNYSYQRKKNPKQDSKPSDGNEIKNYIDKINEITRKKHK